MVTQNYLLFQHWAFYWPTAEIWSVYQMDLIWFCCCYNSSWLSAVLPFSLPSLCVPVSFLPVVCSAPPAKCQENVTLIILHETSCRILFLPYHLSILPIFRPALSTSVSNHILLHGSTTERDYSWPLAYLCKLLSTHISPPHMFRFCVLTW